MHASSGVKWRVQIIANTRSSALWVQVNWADAISGHGNESTRQHIHSSCTGYAEGGMASLATRLTITLNIVSHQGAGRRYVCVCVLNGAYDWYTIYTSDCLTCISRVNNKQSPVECHKKRQQQHSRHLKRIIIKCGCVCDMCVCVCVCSLSWLVWANRNWIFVCIVARCERDCAAATVSWRRLSKRICHSPRTTLHCCHLPLATNSFEALQASFLLCGNGNGGNWYCLYDTWL